MCGPELKLSFKRYAEKDLADLMEMVFGLYDEDPEGMPINEAKIIRTANASLNNPDKVQIYMFRSGGANVGYGMLTFTWSNEYGGDVTNIDEIYVKKEYRNRQAASSFFRHVLESDKNAVMFELEVTPGNKGALRLYKSLGFEASENMHMRRLA